MFDLEQFNDNQRKYLSTIFGGGGIAWSSPFYNLIINFHLHGVNFSIEYQLTVVFCLFLAIIFFVMGFYMLKGERK